MAQRPDIADLVKRASACLPRPVWYPLTQSGEAAIVNYFLAMTLGEAGKDLARLDGLPDLCHIELEYPLPRGKADIVVFHEDGGATVIEAKDGSAGRRSVLAGLGQVASYAFQLGASRGAPKYVKRALLWSACPSPEDDAHIQDVCAASGVMPMLMASVETHRAASEAFIRRLLEREGAQE